MVGVVLVDNDGVEESPPIRESPELLPPQRCTMVQVVSLIRPAQMWLAQKVDGEWQGVIRIVVYPPRAVALVVFNRSFINALGRDPMVIQDIVLASCRFRILNRLAFTPKPCGTSPASARSRGCRFDIISSSWLSPRCIDDELVHEFESVYS